MIRQFNFLPFYNKKISYRFSDINNDLVINYNRSRLIINDLKNNKAFNLTPENENSKNFINRYEDTLTSFFKNNIYPTYNDIVNSMNEYFNVSKDSIFNKIFDTINGEIIKIKLTGKTNENLNDIIKDTIKKLSSVKYINNEFRQYIFANVYNKKTNKYNIIMVKENQIEYGIFEFVNDFDTNMQLFVLLELDKFVKLYLTYLRYSISIANNKLKEIREIL